MPQRSGVHPLDEDPAHQPVPAVIQDSRAGHVTGQHGQKLRLPHQAVNVAAVTDLQHGFPGQEPRIVRSALNENLVPGQPQARQLRDLAQAAPGDHFIPGPSRYAVHDRHHTTGQIVWACEARDTVRVHNNREARTGWLMG